ncbi:hypothetical protein [Dulcicalothrix desertica]|nr:hypothetical protein [Dulcicalothrix desertica]
MAFNSSGWQISIHSFSPAPSNNESTIRYIRFTSVANLPTKTFDTDH